MTTRSAANKLFYTIVPHIMPGLSDNPRPIDEVLRIHLLTEAILEKLISLILEANAEAVLTSRLTYGQKLSICGKLKFSDQTDLLSSDVKGSLKKLNLLRNNVAHDLEHETSNEDVEGLFVGQLGNGRKGAALNGTVWDKLSSYKAMIYMRMLQHE
jgi:hypothetical protein